MSSAEKNGSFFVTAVAAMMASGIFNLYFFLISIVVLLISSVILVIKQSYRNDFKMDSSCKVVPGHDKSSISVINEIRRSL